MNWNSVSVRKIIIVMLCIVFVACTIYCVYSLLNRKSTAEKYFDAESRNFERIAKKIEEYHTSLIIAQKPYMENAYRSRTELTADISGGLEAFGLDTGGQLSDILKKVKLVVDTRSQPNEGVWATTADLLLEKAPFVSAELFSDNEIIWFSVPDLIPKRYFSVQRDGLNEFYDKFSIPVKPLKMVNGKEIAANLAFDGDDFMESAKKLGDIFAEYFTDDNVIDNGANVQTIDGQTIEGMEVLITLDRERATALCRELLTTISEDDLLLSYTYGNFTDLSTLLDDAGFFRLLGYIDSSGMFVFSDQEREMVDRFNVRNDIEGFRTRLVELAEEYQLKEGFKMKVVIDGKGNILTREVLLDLYDAKGAEAFTADVKTGCSNTVFEDPRNKYVDIIVTNHSSGEVTELSINSAFEKMSGTDTIGEVDITCNVTPVEGIKSAFDVSLKITGGTDEAKMKRNDTIAFKVNIVYDDTDEGSLSGTLDRMSWENKKLNTKNNTVRITLDADMPFLGIDGFSAEMSIADEDSFGIDEFSLPDLSQADVTDLNALSDGDMQALEMEIMTSFGKFYLNNKYFFDALLGQ